MTEVIVEPPPKKRRITPYTEYTLLEQSMLEFWESEVATTSDEVKLYEQEPPIEISDNPLQWWQKKEHLYPILSRLAKTFLAIPASQTSSERLFSIAGHIVRKKREGLTQSFVEDLVLLKKNFDLVVSLK